MNSVIETTKRPHSIVHLNIGGCEYSTTVATLCRDGSDSLLADIFSAHGIDRHVQLVQLLPNGSYFIDRDGQLFRYILDYLRTGKCILPDRFDEFERLKVEAEFYRLFGMIDQLSTMKQRHVSSSIEIANGLSTVVDQTGMDNSGYITLGYRGTFAFGRDGQADVKFRKLNRILVCGRATLCREVFSDTLNDSRDPDREGYQRYTARLYLKHQSLEKACDTLAEKGFKLITACSSGANGLASSGLNVQNQSNISSSSDMMNQRNSGDYEEQRWSHYTEYVFYREPKLL